jgi:hypothetical protein
MMVLCDKQVFAALAQLVVRYERRQVPLRDLKTAFETSNLDPGFLSAGLGVLGGRLHL